MDNIIEIQQMSVELSGKKILNDIDLKVKNGEILAIVGGSGAGKTTLLRSILMLVPAKGSIKILDKEILNGDKKVQQWVRGHWGMMFQHGALFSSMNLLENVMFPMKNETNLPLKTMEELALMKIQLVGLKKEAALRYPSELSGGMKKRAAIARALALDPNLLFLDEPTAGLDPHGASELDSLILELRESLGLTVVMVTHDLDTLWRTTDRLAFLGEGKVLAVEPIKAMMHNSNPMIIGYFSDIRAKMAAEKYSET